MECFVALAGNFANTQAAFRRSLGLLAQVSGIRNIKSSRIYKKASASEFIHPLFLHAVCRFDCTIGVNELGKNLVKIEDVVGNKGKKNETSHMIRLDLLFCDRLHMHTEQLTIPHPFWSHHLFVMMPLSELLHENSFPYPRHVEKIIHHHSNHKEKVVPINDAHHIREFL